MIAVVPTSLDREDKRRWAGKILFFLLSFLALTLPFDGYNVLGLGSLFRFMGLFVLVTFFLLLLANWRLMRKLIEKLNNIISFSILLFVFWSGVTIFWAPNPEWAFTRLLSYFGLLGITFATALLSPAAVARLWVALVLGVAISIPLGFVLPHPNPLVAESGRFSSGGKDPNDYANLALIAFVVCNFGTLAYAVRRKRGISFLLPWIAIIAIPLSGSRTALINVIATVSLGLLRKGLRGVIYLLVIIGLSAVGFFSFSENTYVSTFINRASSLTDLQSEDTWAGRLDIWQAAWQVFTEHPLGGVGLANFAWVSPNYSSTAAYISSLREDGGGGVAHNSFLSVLAETGLIGFMLFLLLQASVFLHLWRLRRQEPLAWSLILGLVSYWIASLALTWEYNKIAFFLYGSALALKSRGRNEA